MGWLQICKEVLENDAKKPCIKIDFFPNGKLCSQFFILILTLWKDLQILFPILFFCGFLQGEIKVKSDATKRKRKESSHWFYEYPF